jgi:hypothetical protein
VSTPRDSTSDRAVSESTECPLLYVRGTTCIIWSSSQKSSASAFSSPRLLACVMTTTSAGAWAEPLDLYAVPRPWAAGKQCDRGREAGGWATLMNGTRHTLLLRKGPGSGSSVQHAKWPETDDVIPRPAFVCPSAPASRRQIADVGRRKSLLEHHNSIRYQLPRNHFPKANKSREMRSRFNPMSGFRNVHKRSSAISDSRMSD